MRNATLRLMLDDAKSSIHNTGQLIISMRSNKNKQSANKISSNFFVSSADQHELRRQLSSDIARLRENEFELPPHIDPLLLYNVNPTQMDRVDGKMRDMAICELFRLHKSFYFTLSCKTFNLAVNIVDYFICKVRVKPIYMLCVAAAAYFIAAEQFEMVENRPDPAALVNMTQCGGVVADFNRMVSIILSKVQLKCSTAVDYLHLFLETLPTGVKETGYFPQMKRQAFDYLLASLTCLRVRAYSNECIALAALYLSFNKNSLDNLLAPLAHTSKISFDEIMQCSICMHKSYERITDANDYLLCAIKLSWSSLSRRTRSAVDQWKSRHYNATVKGLNPVLEVDEI